MLEVPLRTASVLISLVVVLGWALFAIGETREASRQSAEATAGRQAASRPDPSPDQELEREAAHGGVREAIDDVNDVLLAPFADVGAGSDSRWIRRSVPAVLALLVYGVGLAFLARFSQGRP